MASFLNNVLFLAVGGGTADFAVDTAVTGYQTPALAGAEDGKIYRLHAESVDKSQWEIVYGAYTAATQTFARTTVLYNSLGTGSGSGQSGAGSKINFSNPPRVGIVALAQDFDIAAQVEQHVQSAGPITVQNSATIVRVNQTVGAAITVNLPAAASKTCPVLIADWKGDAGTNNITIVPNGSEKIQGLSSWIISGDNGSIFLRPISGVGYAL